MKKKDYQTQAYDVDYSLHALGGKHFKIYAPLSPQKYGIESFNVFLIQMMGEEIEHLK